MRLFVLLSILFNCVSFFICQTFAQKESIKWYFGQSAGLDFAAGSPVAITDGVLNTNEGSASISDKVTGAVLFYSDGITVWNKYHSPMPNGTGLGGHVSSTQSALIVPKPGNTMLFYIFTVDAFLGSKGLAYSLIDMSLNGGYGDVVSTEKNITLLTPVTEKLAGIKHCNGQDIWVLCHEWNSNKFYAYPVSTSGIASPVISNAGVVHQGGQGYIGCMKFSPDGYKIALATYDIKKVELFDFDNSSGVVSNALSLPAEGNDYGVSFSPDHSKLYITVDWPPWGKDKLYQFDLSSGIPDTIIDSKTIIDSGYYHYGALQLGPDGKIYMAILDVDYLGVINNPDAAGMSCDFVQNGVSLQGRKNSHGLPNFIESFFDPPLTADFSFIPACSGMPVFFTDSSSINPDTWYWNFGDGYTSTEQNPSHIYLSGGTYSVTLIVTQNCKSDTVTKNILIESLSVDAGSDVSITKGSAVQLHASGGIEYIWSPAAGLSNPFISDPVANPDTTTTYIVTIKDSQGCTGKDSVTVFVTETGSLFIPSAFTPNFDGRNDIFQVYGTTIKTFSMKIFNRWGESVFETENYLEGWDGSIRNKKAEAGVYVYFIEGIFSAKINFSDRGTFLLLR